MNNSVENPNNTEKEITDKNCKIIVFLKKSNKLPLYWTVLALFAALIIAGIAVANVFFFVEFNNPVVIAICSCAIICCAFICATLLLIFSFKYLYNSRKASSQTESTEILKNAYIEYFRDKNTGAKINTPKKNVTDDTAETESNGSVSESN